MKKPEKKEPCFYVGDVIKVPLTSEKIDAVVNSVYNQACDDWEKWIDEAPIEEVIEEECLVSEEKGIMAMNSIELCNAIRKLLKGEE